MMSDSILIALAMGSYMVVIIGIGLYYAKRSNSSTEEYLLGGRSLGPYVTALSAGASDMSGWLLMGLPGLAYWSGIGSPFWTAVGLAIGTYLNWLIVAKRLRVYSTVADDAITLPDYFSNRFREQDEQSKPIMGIASIFILIFFTVYAASCFVTVGKLFSGLFGVGYVPMMIVGAVFVVAYTFIGGFLAETTSDFMQGIVMIIALLTVLVLGVNHAGGVQAVVENAREIPGFLDFFGISVPAVDEAGAQLVSNGQPVFEGSESLGWIVILSSFAWGLGYFGMPQVLIKFMAIRDPKEVKVARQVGSVWAFVSLFVAIAIGIIGRVLIPTEFGTLAAAENVFATLIQAMVNPFFAGIVMAGILAATISSADSYLLIGASAFSQNLYKGIFKKEASDKRVLAMTRLTLVVMTVLGILLSLDENSVIFNIVSYAWAGFGATFGPLMLCSLFTSRITRGGAIAGMVAGGVTVIIWNLLESNFGGIFAVYELLPAFIISFAAILIVSNMTKQNPRVTEQHDRFIETYNTY
ncbi:sodium/proline symporter [Aerococcaceae bacterium DSM 111176]|nr:sodium/proline symporter [Aerococcaceae bacterium DSM 111176]